MDVTQLLTSSRRSTPSDMRARNLGSECVSFGMLMMVSGSVYEPPAMYLSLKWHPSLDEGGKMVTAASRARLAGQALPASDSGFLKAARQP
jgi:hypothetical protein